ncbi:MAG TPA: zf-HC2 domain-containing protein [Solirubrobacteraceae bacterium]|nr:zf-HC2 domain-containing protein [Solirubrobacteraceae bacterium]
MSAPPEEMSCKELVDVITDYLEGTMASANRLRFEAHLAECPYCVSYLEQMRGTIETLGELTEDSIGPEARGELLEAFRSWRER